MKNVKKIIEVKLMGLNELGVKELNDFYKDNILLGYMPELKVGGLSGIKKKRFKQIKSFDKLGIENFIIHFGCTRAKIGEDGNRGGGYFKVLLKHFNHEVYEIEIVETSTKRD
jgi:hypothetical protein